MDDYPDLDDYYEEDYSKYEDKYADDLDMMDDIEPEPEDIDFSVLMKPKTTNIKKDVISSDIASKRPIDLEFQRPSAKRNLGQSPDFVEDKDMLTYSDEEEMLTYSDDEEEIEPSASKRQKTNNSQEINEKETTKPDALTRVNNLLDQLKNHINETSSSSSRSFNQQQRVFTRPTLGEESVHLTSTDGDRVYMKLQPDVEQTKEPTRWASSSRRGLNLLTVPFYELKAAVEEKRMSRAHQQIEQIQNNLTRNDLTAEVKVVPKPAGDLWVEKYMPKKYTELLSDDGTNRVLLQWLKLWDTSVFPRKARRMNSRKKQQEVTKPTNHPPKFNADGKKKFVKKLPWDYSEDLVHDSNGKPKFKIALLCGNPGLGKTTLAHVIARHAGYNVVEMNASDDRSPEVFLNKIEMSTQMKAVIGKEKRPNCLVIDEIDGAPVQAINILLELIKETDAIGAKVKDTKVKKKKKQKFTLSRPIICICNDQFVPALRQLRQAALTLTFPSTIPGRLASRLLDITRNESMSLDMGTLLALSDKAEHDIRSCINTLQFIQQQGDFKAEDIHHMEIGQKDMKKGVRTILHEIFQLPRSNKRKMAGMNKSDTVAKSGASHRFYYMLHLVSSNSDFDKMTQGLYEHYLNAKTKDPYMESVNLGVNWLTFTDHLEKHIQHSQDYVLRRFSPFLPVAFHMYFAKAVALKIPYMNTSFENYQKLIHNQQTQQLMRNGVSPSIRRNLQSECTVLDLIPFLFLITLPTLRPVNFQLYSASEKQVFTNLIGTMISYNLTYRQERNLEGQYTYMLDPNIEELTQFSGMPQHRHLSYALKQLIAREVDLEKMRKREAENKKIPLNPKSSKASSKAASVDQVDIVEAQQLKPKRPVKERAYLDFFGRVVQPKQPKPRASATDDATSSQKEKEEEIINHRLWFKFNSGYTNAVRRTVKIHDFI